VLKEGDAEIRKRGDRISPRTTKGVEMNEGEVKGKGIRKLIIQPVADLGENKTPATTSNGTGAVKGGSQASGKGRKEEVNKR